MTESAHQAEEEDDRRDDDQHREQAATGDTADEEADRREDAHCRDLDGLEPCRAASVDEEHPEGDDGRGDARGCGTRRDAGGGRRGDEEDRARGLRGVDPPATLLGTSERGDGGHDENPRERGTIALMATQGRPVAAVERALAVLDLLAESDEPQGVNAIARALGVSASSASRLLGTLAAHDLVERMPDTGRYRLGVRLLQLGTHVLARLDVRSIARPLLERLEREAGETATLSLPAAGEAVTVDHVPSRRSVRSAALVGRPSVAHATAVGKVVLAFGRGAEAEIPDHLVAYTAHTITDPAALHRAVAVVEQQGYGEADGEREEDLAALGAPVFDHTGDLIAIVGLQGPADRFDEAARRAALPHLLATARELGLALGGSGV